jgi:hypothetical protein
MWKKALVAITAAAALTCAAKANDSTAELATGGLIFVHNDKIEMRSEDLYISTREVRVRYVFGNKTSGDVTVLVAFPMPDVRVEAQDTNVALPTEDPVNLLGFETKVNGRPVTTKVEQHVFAAGIDRTELLRSLNIPLAPHLSATNDALNRLPREKWDELIRIGLAEIEEFDAGKGMQRVLSARWVLRTTFYWEQTFPAGGETVIEHRYRPSVGGTAGTVVGMRPAGRNPLLSNYEAKYCIEPSFVAAVKRAAKAAGDEHSPPFFEERLDYILRTGANWSGPIKNFRLVVDKGDPDNLVTFCGEGVKKIAPTQFEIRQQDYFPTAVLSVIILKRVPR